MTKKMNVLNAESIRAALLDGKAALTIQVYPTIDSTNTEAKRQLRAGAATPLLIVANEQTHGRGRLGRSFYSPADSGVYLTLGMAANGSPTATLRLTTVAAVAVVRALKRFTDRRPAIKWVNDIYLDGKKICGILAEGMSDAASGTVAYVLIGIGVNVFTEEFPEAIALTAASLGLRGLNRNILVATIVDELLDCLLQTDPKRCMDDYRAHSMVIGHSVRYIENGVSTRAKAIGVDDEGGLLVERLDGTVTLLRTGEITLRLDEP